MKFLDYRFFGHLFAREKSMAERTDRKRPREENNGGAGGNAVAQAERDEAESFRTGPLSVLYAAVHTPNCQVLVSCRNDKKLVGTLRAFDRHFNMVLQGVTEAWAVQKKGAAPEVKTRFLDKVFLRGDGVILVAKILNSTA